MKKYALTVIVHFLIGGSAFGILTLIDAVNGGGFHPMQQLTLCSAITHIFGGYDLINLKADGENAVTKCIRKFFLKKRKAISK